MYVDVDIIIKGCEPMDRKHCFILVLLGIRGGDKVKSSLGVQTMGLEENNEQ